MDCPKCKEKAIKFTDWIRAKNAFSTSCTSCGINLKANNFVYLNFIITLLVMCLLFPYVEDVLSYLDIHIEVSKFKIVVLLPVIFIGGVLGWCFGGYKVKT
ncbi:hypothetical protein ACM9HF_13815 [Colwellia sp. RE-S-Sl-9]